MKAQRPDRQNPVFARPQTGVAANHSSSVPSTDHSSEADHPQFDDHLQDVPPPQDPNISGYTPTEGTYTWLAGGMDGWKENDDYREFFEQSRGPDSRLCPDTHDGDYDDNGGFPTQVGHDRGVFDYGGGGVGEGNDIKGATGYPLGIIVRRI